MHIYCEILIAFIGSSYILHSECTADTSYVFVGEKGKELRLTWNITNSEQLDMMAFYYDKIEESNRLGDVVSHRNPPCYASIRKRISLGLCFFQKGFCRIALTNLKFEDSGTYFAEYRGYQKGNFISLKTYEKVSLIVNEKAKHCGNVILPSNFISNAGEVVTGNVTLCGKPKPVLTWYIKNEVIKNKTVDENMKDDHKYTYSFQLTIKPWMCGQSISYYGTGFKNTVSASSVILIPDYEVTDVVFTQTVGCPILTWKADDHGLCEVDMVLSFIWMDNSTINVTVPVANEIFNNCNYTLNSTMLTYQTIVYWKKYEDRIQRGVSKISDYLVLRTTTTTTTTTTTSTTLNTTGTKDIGHNTDRLTHFTMKIVGSLLGGIVLGIVLTSIAFRIWSRRGKVQANIEEVELQSGNKSVVDQMNENSLQQTYPLSSTKHVYEDIHEYSNVPEARFYEVNEQPVLPNPKDVSHVYQVM